MEDKEIEKLFVLIEKQIDNSLTDEEAAELEDIILSSEEARKIYIDTTSFNSMIFEKGIEAAVEIEDKSSKKIIFYQVALLAAAAMIIFMFVMPENAKPVDNSIAVLTKTEDCEWKDSSLPTVSGAKLNRGNLNLIKGLATVTFKSGAEMVIEAPAEIELIDEMNCLVKHGTVMAEVPDSAHGFTIDTPKAKAIDHGTKFVVSYNKMSEKSLVEVLEGEVEVKPQGKNKSEHFFEGHAAMVKDNTIRRINSVAERKLTVKDDEHKQNIIKITTADGRGMDQAIDFDKGTKNRHIYYLTVKNTESSLRRKSYIKFDLAKLGTAHVKSVKFKVRAVPAGYGSASLIPEISRFSVYGITDESLDNWDEKTINWENAPVNVKKGNELDFTKVEKLGQFELKRSVQDKVIIIETEALQNFINSDSNGVVTLVLVRETGEFHNSGMVHAFASKEHPIDAPPTLEFEVSQ